jgi:hypothetical protein
MKGHPFFQGLYVALSPRISFPDHGDPGEELENGRVDVPHGRR